MLHPGGGHDRDSKTDSRIDETERRLPLISIVIPAFQEAERVAATVAAVRQAGQELDEPFEVIVVDDGSADATSQKASAADRVIRLERNRGKGAALSRGLVEARGEWIVMLDADLGETAAEFPRLVHPLRSGEADMTIATFARVSDSVRYPTPDTPLPTPSPGGFGLALRAARWGVALLTGRVLAAPLSGQRALRAAHLPLLTPLEPGFGLEVGLDIDALRGRLRVVEIPTVMRHAGTGRDWAGFRHRGRQMAHILRTLARRALRRRPATKARWAR